MKILSNSYQNSPRIVRENGEINSNRYKNLKKLQIALKLRTGTNLEASIFLYNILKL